MARRPSSSHEHARRGDAGELARVRGMAALTEGHRRLVGGRSAAMSFRKKSEVRWLACRSCHGAGDDDLVENLRSKVQRCRWLWVDLAKEEGTGVSAGLGEA
jgi:hypothetical protein